MIDVNVNISGVNELKAAIEDVNYKFRELNHALSDLRRALFNMGVEINQPPAGTDD